MPNQLNNMMAELESWESAAEFGIPEELWAGYQIRTRSDDLYIALLSAVFDALRDEDVITKKSVLADLAKTLLVYSQGAASTYLSGVSRYLSVNAVSTREGDLIVHLRHNAEDVVAYLKEDQRVPELSLSRICKELKISASS